jgi:hypothetical protein
MGQPPDAADPREWIRSELRQSLQALAAPVDVQIVTFAPFACVACELLETYDNFSGAARGLDPPLSAQLPMALQPVDTAISRLSPSYTTCHQSESLRASPRWAEVRRAATMALMALNWPPARPIADAPLGDGTWGRNPQSEPE